MRISDWSSDVCSSDLDVIDDEIESTNGEAIELVSTADIGVGSGYRNSNKPAVFGQAVRNDRHGAEQRTLFIACNDLQAGQHRWRSLQVGRWRAYRIGQNRTEESRVGKGGVSTCRS